MPSPHPNPHTGPGATPKQLRYLRALAHRTGQTFTYPQTKAQASAEIQRLKAAPRQDWIERASEREQLASTPVPRDSARVREHEITGRGAHAHWTHTRPQEDRS